MANRNTIQDWLFTPIKTTRKFRDDLAGTQIESLFVIGLAGRHKTLMYWLCECDCGEYVFISTGQLTRTDKRRSRSCGCRNKQPKKHGYAKTKVHRAWCYIKDRCLNPNSQDYASYGGAGITMYEGWVHNFKAFLEHIGEPPSRQHSIDRWPNKFGNYEPNNIRWATPEEQARNTKTNRLITFNGQTKCLAEWGNITGISADTIGWRLSHNWSVERALTAPVMYNHPL